MSRKDRMYILDVQTRPGVVQRYDANMDDDGLGGYESYRAGEWVKLVQESVSDGDALTAKKITTAPTKTNIAAKFAPVFTDTDDNSSADAVKHLAYVDGPHEAWTDYYSATPTAETQLTVVNGRLVAAGSAELVVARCLSGVTARSLYSQGAPAVNMIRYKTVEPYVYVS